MIFDYVKSKKKKRVIRTKTLTPFYSVKKRVYLRTTCKYRPKFIYIINM